MTINSEAIDSTRPWKIAGEGPTRSSGATPCGRLPQFAPGDMRFTTKGDSLYAIALAWPADGKLLIKSLATGSPHSGGEIARGGLLGSEPNLVWSRNADGVAISGTQNVLGSYWFLRDGSPVLAAGNLTAAFLPWQELSG